MGEVTRILEAIDAGYPRAAEELLPLVYDELRNLAAQKLAHEKPGQTLQATALVHEAYIRLVGAEDQKWDGRGHFFAAAAEAMRRILINCARRKKQLKHGGGLRRLNLDDAVVVSQEASDEILALDAALSKLAQRDRQKAELVKLRFFSGLTTEQAANVLGISRTTAKRAWAYSRAWLQREIQKSF
jgi:RNA polymerase sigma factor (TIGR02999 family)